MKKISLILLTLLLPLVAFAYTSPGKPVGLVNDFAHVLTPSESQSIGEKLLALNKQTGVELAVVTVPTIGTDETIESYAVKLFEEWGIGNKEKDTGLLLLVAVNDRQMRIETGYGIEGAVTDIQSGNIIRNVLTPAFKAGKYGEGISGAVDALTAIITKSPDAVEYSVPSSDSGLNSSFLKNLNFPEAFFVVVLIINILSRLLGKTKSWWLGGVLGAIVGAIIGFFTGLAFGIGSVIFLTILGLLFDFIVSKRPPGSSGGGMSGIWPIFLGGGRGGSGGFGGGGFGGFGGGSSGGGGASGRW